MSRLLWSLLFTLVLIVASESGVVAQEPAPGAAAASTPAAPSWPRAAFTRGEGFYLNPIKIGISWAVFVLWVLTLDWINQDIQRPISSRDASTASSTCSA